MPSIVAVDYTRVYPRVCGGTRPTRSLMSSSLGLSPRVRGNLRIARRRGWSVGSIPACAGEPLMRCIATG